MSCHTVPDTMISLGTRFYSLAITLPRCTACVYCLEHTCQIKEQLMHLIFNYCLALQTTGKCQSEQSCTGATKTDIFSGKERNTDKICMDDSVVLQFTVTKKWPPKSWIIYHHVQCRERSLSRRVCETGSSALTIICIRHVFAWLECLQENLEIWAGLYQLQIPKGSFIYSGMD